MILMFECLSSSQREGEKINTQKCKGDFINATATIPQSRKNRREQKIQSVCNGAVLTNVTIKHTLFPEENPFLIHNEAILQSNL